MVRLTRETWTDAETPANRCRFSLNIEQISRDDPVCFGQFTASANTGIGSEIQRGKWIELEVEGIGVLPNPGGRLARGTWSILSLRFRVLSAAEGQGMAPPAETRANQRGAKES